MGEAPPMTPDGEFETWLSGLNDTYDRAVSDAHSLTRLGEASLPNSDQEHDSTPPRPTDPGTHREPQPEVSEGVSRAKDTLLARIQDLRHLSARELDKPVVGPHGQNLTVAEAQARAELLDQLIELEQTRGSLRHRRASRFTRVLTWLTVPVIDLPIILWLASSVFNVDWANPLGLPLAISVVISVLATGGAATALHHLGHNQRQHKDHRRQLVWAEVTTGARLSLAAAGLLVGIMGTVMFVRVHTEGVLGGLGNLAVLLAVLVALVATVSATLVFWTAFRDGSLDQDDLRYYSSSVRPHLDRKREYEAQAHELRCQYDLLVRQSEREDPARPEDPDRNERPRRHASGRG
jgi:hypothetical protein